jgi:hypothetical protein
VVPVVDEPLVAPAAPELLVGLVDVVEEGETVPVAVPAAEPIPDADPEAEPVPAHAARPATQARDNSNLITFCSLHHSG